MGPSKSPACHVWRAADETAAIRLNIAVVDRLGFAVFEGVQALPRRGLEIGGFLLGSVRRENHGRVVEIKDYEPIECEHAVGPSFLLTGADRKAVEARLGSNKQAGTLEIVGFYRSHTRKDFANTPEDSDLFSAYFPERFGVFLLIHALRNETPMAQWSLWNGRGLKPAEPDARFPFRSSILSAGKCELAGTDAEPESEPAKVPHASPVAASALTAQPQGLGRRNGWMTEIGGVLANVRLHRPGGLFAARVNASWIAAAALVIATGLAALVPRASVTAVTQPAPSPRQSEPTVALPQPSASPAGQTPAVSISAPEPAPVIPSAAIRTQPVLPVRRPAPVSRAPLRAENKRDRSAPPALKVIALSTVVPAPLPEPPPVALTPERLEAAAATLEKAEPIAPPVANPFVGITMDVNEPASGGLLHKLPFFGKHRPPVDFTPPSAVRQASVDVPKDLRERVKHEIPIAVRVYIDSTGKVEFAELVSGGGGIKRDLGALAVFSSLHWQFSPATSEGQPVASEVLLRYRFGAQLH